jgi:PAS domain S-box-containing protein
MNLTLFMSLRLKLSLACFILVLLTVGIGEFGRNVSQTMAEIETNIYDKAFPGSDYGHQVEEGVLLLLVTRAGASFDDEATRKQFAKLLDIMDVVVERASTDKTRELAASLRVRLANIAANPSSPDVRGQLLALEGELAKMVRKYASDGFVYRSNADKLVADADRAMIIGMTAAGLLALAVAIALQAAIIPPIRRASAIATSIARGKLDNPIALRGRDETAQLLTALDTMQRSIAEREARLRSIIETAPDAVITIDERGIVQSFSAAAVRLFGYAADEVIGHNVKMLMPTPHRESHDGSLARYLRTGGKHIIGISRQVEARRKDGSIFPVQLAVGEVKLGEARIFSGFITDLTSRIKMEQDLRQAQKMEAIGQLTGGVAHDFNNLLTVIFGNLEMLERRLKDAEHREILKDAQEASRLGAELAKRLLAFGRRQSLDPKPVDLNALVGGMAHLLRRSLGEMVEIETRLTEGLPMIMVDLGQVESALLNLAINARDAMPKGGRLVIETARSEIDADYSAVDAAVAPGDYITLSVTDTGAGMAPEVRQRAFEPFYTTKGPGAGSGLGLSMVYGFVKQSGGHVQLDSELGHGTTVRLYLPARDDDAEVTEWRAAAPVTRAASGETVLVVEDDQRVRRVSVHRLKELGYAVIEADSGSAALLVLDREEPIDLLFTDVVMPGGMTGIDVAHEARRRRPELKILFTSGYAEPALIEGGKLTVNAGWLGKPYSIDELDATLRELFER